MTEFKISDKITIEAEYYETRYSWGHKAYLWVDGRQVDYKKATYYNRTWESYTYQSVMQSLVEKTKELTKEEKALCQEWLKEGHETDKSLSMVAGIAMLGEIFGSTPKEKNDWKERMLKAGLENKGLIMPDDWNELSEVEKQRRLDGAIQAIA